MKNVHKPVCLVIMDGWGVRQDEHANAVVQGKTPFYDKAVRDCPFATLRAEGENVGLPPGYQGNSEVGHLNIGAGRVVYQMLMRINRDIGNGSFFNNKVFLNAVENCKKNGSTLHLMGLVQDQGVHAVSSHCEALLELAKKKTGFLMLRCTHLRTDVIPRQNQRQHILAGFKKKWIR
ncbi:MAG: hypothetical protein ABIA63_07685 [bacterium]